MESMKLPINIRLGPGRNAMDDVIINRHLKDYAWEKVISGLLREHSEWGRRMRNDLEEELYVSCCEITE